MGAAPTTMAQGIGFPSFWYLSQWRYPPDPPMRDDMRTARRFVLFSAARLVDILAMPFSGSLVIQSVAVNVGAASNPGVETGTGRRARPSPGFLRSSPVITTSWQLPRSTTFGGIGLATAVAHAERMRSTGQAIPIE